MHNAGENHFIHIMTIIDGFNWIEDDKIRTTTTTIRRKVAVARPFFRIFSFLKKRAKYNDIDKSDKGNITNIQKIEVSRMEPQRKSSAPNSNISPFGNMVFAYVNESKMKQVANRLF